MKNEYYTLTKESKINNKVEVGNTYKRYHRQHEKCDRIILDGFGEVEELHLEPYTDICNECGNPKQAVQAEHKGTGFYVCLCDFDFSDVENFYAIKQSRYLTDIPEGLFNSRHSHGDYTKAFKNCTYSDDFLPIKEWDTTKVSDIKEFLKDV